MIESSLGVHGDEILYVGDHIYTDVSQSKVHLRWRTALICRELEEEVSIFYSTKFHIGSSTEQIRISHIFAMIIFLYLRLHM